MSFLSIKMSLKLQHNITNKHLMKKYLFTILLSLFGLSTLLAQNNSEEDLRRMFLYHFIKYIDWPDDDTNTDFNIAVLNDNTMYQLLKSTLENAERKGRKILISKINASDDIDDFQVVYIPRNQSKHFATLHKKSTDLNLLFITDKNGIIEEGSCINFKTKGNKLRFEINLKVLEERGLKVAGRLKQVAILI